MVKLRCFFAGGRVSMFIPSWKIASILALVGGSLLVGTKARADFTVTQRQDDLVEVDFTSVVALAHCSGSLVRFTTSLDSDKAIILTNGHCLADDIPHPGEAFVDRPSSQTFQLLSSDAQTTVATLTATSVIYSTMTGTDITLYRLNMSYADIKSNYGIPALTLAEHRALPGDPIRVVSGYWKRIYSCTVDDFVYKLVEAGWTWFGSMRYKQPGCYVIDGTSGSPVINPNTREVVAVNNTTNKSGKRCLNQNPCEVDVDGNVFVTQGASYAQDVVGIYSCLTADNNLDLTAPNCKLQRPQATPAQP